MLQIFTQLCIFSLLYLSDTHINKFHLANSLWHILLNVIITFYYFFCVYFCLIHILIFLAGLYLITYTIRCHYNFLLLFYVYLYYKYIYFLAGLYLLTYTIRCHYEFVFPISRDADFSGSFKYLTFLNVVSLFYKQSKIDC